MTGCVDTVDCEGQTMFCNLVTNRCHSCYIICDSRYDLELECMKYCPDMFLQMQQLHTDLQTTATEQIPSEQDMPDKSITGDINTHVIVHIIIFICLIVLVAVSVLALIVLQIRLRHTGSSPPFHKKKYPSVTLGGPTENGKMKPDYIEAFHISPQQSEKVMCVHQNQQNMTQDDEEVNRNTAVQNSHGTDIDKESESSRLITTDSLNSSAKCTGKSPRGSLCNKSETTAAANDVRQPHDTKSDTSVCRNKCEGESGKVNEDNKITNIQRRHQEAQASKPTVPQRLHTLQPQEIETDDVRLEIEEFYGVHHKVDEAASCSSDNKAAYKDISLLDAQTDEQVDPGDVKLLSQLVHVNENQVGQNEQLLNSIRVRKYSTSKSDTGHTEETLLKEPDSSEDPHQADSVRPVQSVEEKPVSPHPNNRIYDELNKIGWVRSVYSEGQSIYIDLDLNDISEEMAVQELIWRTGCGPKKFHLRHRECIL